MRLKSVTRVPNSTMLDASHQVCQRRVILVDHRCPGQTAVDAGRAMLRLALGLVAGRRAGIVDQHVDVIAPVGVCLDLGGPTPLSRRFRRLLGSEEIADVLDDVAAYRL